MKKNIFALILLVLALSIPLYACEQSTKLRTATIKESTMSGSENYVVNIAYAEDKRLDGIRRDSVFFLHFSIVEFCRLPRKTDLNVIQYGYHAVRGRIWLEKS